MSGRTYKKQMRGGGEWGGCRMVGGDGEGVEELKEDGRRLIKLKKQK